MNDINRIVIFLLLVMLLYVLYKYQHLIFENFNIIQKAPQEKKEKKQKTITIDNISQLSIDSLENENVYKPESLLGSLNSGNGDIRSLLEMSDNSEKSQETSFF